MPRISDQELARVKETPLETLARARGFSLEKRGNDLALSCPFHEEKTASCIITPSKNIFHCFGCGEGGSVIDWVMKLETVSFRHAVEILTNDPTATGPQTVNKLQNPFDASKPILDQAMSFYQGAIVDDEPALAFLEKRGLLEAIEPFKLGASNRTLGLHLPLKNRKEGAEIRMRLIESGVYRANGREHLRGSVVVPFFQNDVVTEMYGRKYGSRLRKGTPHHLYLKGQHKGILNHQNLAHEIILCEAPLDAMSFFVAGVSSVTTSFGTEGITDELFERLIKAKKIHIAFDNDNAGNRAAKNLAERLVAHDIEVNRVEFPNEQDANDVLAKSGKATLLKLVKRSVFVGGISIPKRLIPLVAQDESATTEATEAERPKEAQAANKSALNVVAEKDEATISFGDRKYRIRNLKKNLSFGVMKINLLVKKGERFHVDNLDLYTAKARAAFAKALSIELGITVESAKGDLGKLLLLLDEYQGEAIDQSAEDKPVELTDEERAEAMALLQNPNLMDQILDDFETLGMVGEETNKLTGYLAATSRKLSKPLAIVVQSSSAAGKSSLMDAVLAFVPEEEKVTYSAMTGQSLFYMEGGNLKHKVLAVAEEEGAERASYALKILQSEGKLKIASTGKDIDTGRHTTSAYEVEGPTAIFTTTTSIDVDEELLNRCLVLTVDEDQAQTSEIQNRQRAARSTLRERDTANKILKLHQNAQRLLSPIEVVNPFAPFLTFPSHRVRLRRDHIKYLTLIDTVALLHQHQRKTGEGERAFVTVEPQDIDISNQIFKAIISRSLDELPPQTRRVLESIDTYVQRRMNDESQERHEVIFTRKQIRDALQVSATQLHLHLQRLTDLEYVVTSRLKGSRTLLYRLMFGADYDDDSSFAFTSGKEAQAKANQIRGIIAPNSGQIPKANIIAKLRASEGLKRKRRAKFLNSETHSTTEVVKMSSYKKAK